MRKPNRTILASCTFSLVWILLSIQRVQGETRVAGSTVPVISTVTLTPLIDNFDRGGPPNLWGGSHGCFKSEASASILSSYDSGQALGGTGHALKITFNTPNSGSWAGCFFTLGPNNISRNISTYESLNFWIKNDSSTQSIKIVLENDNSPDSEHRSSALYLTDYLDNGITSSWQEVKIPLDAFANLDSLTNVKNIVFVFEHNVASTNFHSTSGTIYLDNLAFGTTFLQVVRIDHFGDKWSLNAMGGNIGDMSGGQVSSHNHSFDALTYHHFPHSLRSEYNVTNGWAGMFFIFGGGSNQWTAQPHNFARYYNVSFWIRSDIVGVIIKVELVDNLGPRWALIPNNTTTPEIQISTNWQKYTIPFLNFGGLLADSIKQMNIVYEDWRNPNNKTGVVFFDEIQFEY